MWRTNLLCNLTALKKKHLVFCHQPGRRLSRREGTPSIVLCFVGARPSFCDFSVLEVPNDSKEFSFSICLINPWDSKGFPGCCFRSCQGAQNGHAGFASEASMALEITARACFVRSQKRLKLLPVVRQAALSSPASPCGSPNSPCGSPNTPG